MCVVCPFVLMYRLTKHTVQQVTVSMTDVLLLCSLRGSFVQLRRAMASFVLSLATKESVELMRLYQSACRVFPVRRRVLLKCSFFYASKFIRKDDVCWCQKWGSKWFFFVNH